MALAGSLALLRGRPSGIVTTRWQLRLLRYGWGNPGAKASEAYLLAIIQACRDTVGPVVETGSGLSTVVAAAVLSGRGVSLISLEHALQWSALVEKRLHSFTGVSVLTRPLVAHDSFDWYDVSPGELPDGIRLVICDGPPGTTRGGRYGLLPVLLPRLAPGAEILLDDAARPQEQEAIARWRDEFGVCTELVLNPERDYARVIVP